MNTELAERILTCMAEVLNQNGFRAEVMKSESAPTLLRCEAMRQGKVQRDVLVECCFIPMALPSEDTGLLQCFATLFDGAPERNAAQLRRACTYCNDFCALGAFGCFAEAGQVYLKHNTLIDGTLELQQIVTFIADNLSLLLASVSRFIDGLAAVGFSGTPLEGAIAQELFPQL